MMNKEEAVLQVRDLLLRYGNGCEYCRSRSRWKRTAVPAAVLSGAVRNVSFDVYPGEVLGIVGESGSGKSSVMKSLYFDHEVTGGSAFLKQYQDGKVNIFGASSQQRRYIKNHLMGMVYQNPLLGLRMDYSSAANVAEKIIAAGNRNVAFMDGRTVELLEAVEILTSRRAEPPRNFSGGMQQRVQISKALANNPGLLLLDEVTTGLDLSVQAKVLDLIRKIRSRYNISIILVSHDLAVIRMLADRTMVMLDGQVVESGLTDQILEDPAACLYTAAGTLIALTAALPRERTTMKTAIYNGKLITPAEVLENKVLVLENDRIIDILAEDVIDLGQYDEKIDAHGRYVCPGFIVLNSDKIEQIIAAASYQRDGSRWD